MTRIKICGLTNLDDALAALDAGADLLGFVLAQSPRQIGLETACRLVEQLPPQARFVLVVRNQPLGEVQMIARQVPQCTIQVHGEEPPEFAETIPADILRRVAVRPNDTHADLANRIANWPAPAHLLDPGAGAGQAFTWPIACGLDGRVFVAGGLTPDNVGEAIRQSRPYGVDVSSGVESSPGRKDPLRVAAFVKAVREADALTHAR